MARALPDRQLIPAPADRIRFAVATQRDDAGIRHLLRENPMRGRIAITLEREPDYFAEATLPGQKWQTIIARENNRLICVGSCVVRETFVNGRSARVGYLGGLRLDASAAGRSGVIRRGYEFFRELQEEDPADFYFTSIAADNVRARNFLERQLPGMPQYEFLDELVTSVVPVNRSSTDVERSASGSWDEISAFVNFHNRGFQFAAAWSPDQLAAACRLGLCADDFVVVRETGKIVAAAAVWDQRSFKQAVIRDYAPWLRCARVPINFAARLTGRPILPAPGNVVPLACVSFFAAPAGRSDLVTRLSAALHRIASRKGVDLLMFGFSKRDPRLGVIRSRSGFREYRSRLYVVHWPGIGCARADLDRRMCQPEVSLL